MTTHLVKGTSGVIRPPTGGSLTVDDDSGFGDVVTNVTHLKFYGGMVQVLDDGGGEAGVNPLPYAVRLELSTNFLTSGVSQTVPFDNVIYDPFDLTSAHANEITLKASGLYVAECEIESGTVSSISPFAGIQLNGTDVALDQVLVDTVTGTAAYFHLSTGLNYYNAGDRFKVFIASQSPGAAVDGGAGTAYNHFTLLRLG